MDNDDELLDFSKMAPVFVHPFDDMPDEPAPTPRRSSPVSATRPAYGLAGTPASTVRTRDVKVALVSFSLGAAVVSVLCWLARRRV